MYSWILKSRNARAKVVKDFVREPIRSEAASSFDRQIFTSRGPVVGRRDRQFQRNWFSALAKIEMKFAKKL